MIYYFNLNSTLPAIGDIIVVNNITDGSNTMQKVISIHKTDKNYEVTTQEIKENY